MQKLLWIIPVAALLAGCDPINSQQAFGTAGGVALGAVATPDDPLRGALIGGTVGLIAGTVLSRQANGQCTWQRPDGSQYLAPCPA